MIRLNINGVDYFSHREYFGKQLHQQLEAAQSFRRKFAYVGCIFSFNSFYYFKVNYNFLPKFNPLMPSILVGFLGFVITAGTINKYNKYVVRNYAIERDILVWDKQHKVIPPSRLFYEPTQKDRIIDIFYHGLSQEAAINLLPAGSAKKLAQGL